MMKTQSPTPKVILDTITVKTLTGESVQLKDLLSQPITVLHFQNSFRQGQTCSVVMPTIEENLEAIQHLADVKVIVRETPFDEYVDTPVSQFIMSKADLATLNILGEDSYIERTSLIVDRDGNILATLPADQDRLEVYFTEDIVNLLKILKTAA
jgi:hypothetical protein